MRKKTGRDRSGSSSDSDSRSSLLDSVDVDSIPSKLTKSTAAERAERRARFEKVRVTEDIGEERAHALDPPLVPCVVQFRDLTFNIKVHDPADKTKMIERRLLSNVSGNVKPGEFLSVMGPTGSGKTTLMEVLSQRKSGDISGDILVNGYPPGKDYKRQMAFVTQDDIFLSQLTVYQTLHYQAQLRLGQLSAGEKKRHVDALIDALGLENARNNIMGGGPFSRGISGGEAKRVNIGNELLSQPSVLLLDEPTSGLDTSTALKIMQLLKALANAGFTVLAAIHQPSSQMFRLFDKLMVLVDGQTIYYGKANESVAYFAGIGLQCDRRFNPADFMMGLILEEELQNKGKSPMKKYLTHSWAKRHDSKTAAELVTKEDKKMLKICQQKQDTHGTPSYTTTFFQQLAILTHRSFTQIRRDLFDPLDFMQTILVGFISGFLWFNIPMDSNNIQNRIGALFFMAMFMGFFRPLFQAILFFPAERAVILRERRSGSYRLPAYYFSKLLSTLPVVFLHPFIFVCIFYPMVGLHRTFANFILLVVVMFVSVITADGWGTMISTIAGANLKHALVISTVFSLGLTIIAGFFIQHLPWWLTWIKYIGFFTFVFQALLVNEFSGSEFANNIPTDLWGGFGDVVPGEAVIAANSIIITNIGYHVLVILGYGILFRIVGYFALLRSMRNAPT